MKKKYLTSMIKFSSFITVIIILGSCNCSNSQNRNNYISLPKGISTVHVPERIRNTEKNIINKSNTDNEENESKSIQKGNNKDNQDTEPSRKKSNDGKNAKGNEKQDEDEFGKVDSLKKDKKKDAIKQSKEIPIDIFVPENENIIGDILVLPGWRFSRKRWHQETDLLKFAEKFGFRAIFPEMGITNYESRYFPETTMKWSITPGGKWIKEIMIPMLQKEYGLLLPDKRNYLLGLSTGGRGVLLISLQNPKLFTAGATLSGDCNQAKIPHDRLMTAAYGPYTKFRYRWHTIDNPEISAMKGKWKMPLYIGHGKRDRIAPFSQSRSLFITLKKYYPKLKVILNAPKEGKHNFTYWNSEVEPVLKFFTEIE